jgi:Peptidase family M41
LLAGPAKKSAVKKPDTLRLTAYHEGGHTLAAMLIKGTSPLHKVTILPRGHSGGATYSLPRDEEYRTRENLMAEMDVCMGGRAAEELVNGPNMITTGAGSDMKQASNLARAIVMQLSMSQLGLTYHSSDDPRSKPSPEKQAAIDAEVEKLLQESYKRVLNLLAEKRKELDLLAAALLEHETLSAEQCQDVIAGKKLPPPLTAGSKPSTPAAETPRDGQTAERKRESGRERLRRRRAGSSGGGDNPPTDGGDGGGKKEGEGEDGGSGSDGSSSGSGGSGGGGGGVKVPKVGKIWNFSPEEAIEAASRAAAELLGRMGRAWRQLAGGAQGFHEEDAQLLVREDVREEEEDDNDLAEEEGRESDSSCNSISSSTHIRSFGTSCSSSSSVPPASEQLR